MHIGSGSAGVIGGRRLALEPLEQRLLLNGNVLAAVIGGNLVIVGDTDNNQIDIYQNNGTITVEGTDGTTVNGGATFNAPALVNNINIAMNDGADDVDIFNLTYGGNINYEGGQGHDRFRLRFSGIAGAVNVNTGFDDDQVWLEGLGIGGNVSIETGVAPDFVRVLNAGFGGNLSIVSSHFDLEADIDNILVRGNLLVDGGQGSLGVDIGSEFDPGALVGGSLIVRTSDFLEAGIGHSRVRNGISVMAGRWDAQIGLLDVATTNLNIQTQDALPGEVPEIFCAMGDIRLAGSLSFAAGDGFWGTVFLENSVMGGSLSVLWEDLDGEEADVLLDPVFVGGNVQVTGNLGDLFVGIDGLASGGSIGIQGNFLTEVEALGMFARGNLNVDFGPGFLVFSFTNGAFGGSLNVNGAAGIELMQIFGVGVRGNANINTGDGSVDAVLSGLGIGGDLNVSNGAGAVADYEIRGVTVRGDVNVDSNALLTDLYLSVLVGGNVNVQTGLGPDGVFMQTSFVRGNMTIQTDGGNDVVALGNNILIGNLSIDTGAGEDDVLLAVIDVEPTGPPLIIGGNTTVLTQGDADYVQVGSGSEVGRTVQFGGSVLMNGGPGVDELDLGGFNTFSQVPSFVSFEII